MELKQYTWDELQALLTEVDGEIELRRRAKVREFLIHVKDKVEELGITPEQLLSVTKSKPPKQPVPAVYANPLNAQQTWSGRGRKPDWFLNALKNGASPDSLKIAGE